VAGGDQTQADVGFASSACDVDEGRHSVRFEDRECAQIDDDRPGCCGELLVVHVLETGCRHLVETPAGMDHRHAGPEMIESESEGSGRDRMPIGVRAHWQPSVGAGG
jgi:hypothetical protein